MSLYLVDAPVVDGMDVPVGLFLGARVAGAAALPAALMSTVFKHPAQAPTPPTKDLLKRFTFIVTSWKAFLALDCISSNSITYSLILTAFLPCPRYHWTRSTYLLVYHLHA